MHKRDSWWDEGVLTVVSSGVGAWVGHFLERHPVIGATVGAIVGLGVAALVRFRYIKPLTEADEFGERLVRQIDRAQDEVRELSTRLAKYEEGPSFKLAPAEPVFMKPPSHFLIVLPIRVTNDGAPGAVIRWRVLLRFRNGDEYEANPWPIDGPLVLGGNLAGRVAREDLISEKTGSRVERRTTVSGFFVGAFPVVAHGRTMDEPAVLRLECIDDRGQCVFLEMTTQGRANSAEVATLQLPGLSPLVLRPSPIEQRGAPGKADGPPSGAAS